MASKGGFGRGGFRSCVYALLCFRYLEVFETDQICDSALFVRDGKGVVSGWAVFAFDIGAVWCLISSR